MKTAKNLGKAAHANDINIPAHDPALMAMLNENHEENMTKMKAWLTGWEEENDKQMKKDFPEFYA